MPPAREEIWPKKVFTAKKKASSWKRKPLFLPFSSWQDRVVQVLSLSTVRDASAPLDASAKPRIQK